MSGKVSGFLGWFGMRLRVDSCGAVCVGFSWGASRSGGVGRDTPYVSGDGLTTDAGLVWACLYFSLFGLFFAAVCVSFGFVFRF